MAIGSLSIFKEGAHSRFFGYRKPIAGLQARVYIPFIASRRSGRSARDLILLQNEDSLLPRLELGCTGPSHVPGERKPDNHLIPFEFWPLKD